MPNGKQVMKKALSHVGAREIPLGSNTGPFVQECQTSTGFPGTGWPWCAGFVCRIAHEAGVVLPFKSPGAHVLADHYPAVEFIHAKPGDVFDWNIGSGHTSIMVEKGNDWVRTVDGNWGDAVQVVIHPTSEIRRIWRMPGVDDSAPPVPAPRRESFFTVATSRSGHRVLLLKAAHKRRVLRLVANAALGRWPNGITIRKHKR